MLYEEKETLLAVSQGDETAFTRLFEHWQPVLASFIFRITRSREIAAEIVQDVFLKIWMSREVLGSIDNFKGYLLVVSKNHAINVLRKSMREQRNLERWTTTQQDHAEPTSPSPDMQEETVFTLIDEAIERLPERQKQVFLLHRYERLTYAQIAQQLGIGKESVKTHLALAIKSISKYLHEKANFLIGLLLIMKKIF
jgi:RNA polymerase sigma-70 factor (family 1)